MVAYGYILPKKNIDTRLETLQKGLKNQNIKNINAKANLNLYSPLTITSAVPTITQQTGQPQQTKPIFSPLPPKGDETRQAEPVNIPTKIDEIRQPERLNELYQLSGLKEDEIRPAQFVSGSNIDTRSIIEYTEDLLQRMIKKRYETFGKVAEQTLNLSPENVRTLSQQYSAEDKKKRIAQVQLKKKVLEELQKKPIKIIKDELIKELQTNTTLIENTKIYLKKLYDELEVPEYDRINLNTAPLKALNNEIADVFYAYEKLPSKSRGVSISSFDDFSDISDEIPMLETPPPSTVMPPPSNTTITGQTWTSSQDIGFQNLDPMAKKVILFYEAFQNSNLSLPEFKRIIQDNSGKLKSNLSGDNRENKSLRIPISNKDFKTTEMKEKTIENKAFKYYKKNHNRFYERIVQLNQSEFSGLLGSGLTGGKVKSPYYSSYSPNFGNLHLMENSLKKNQLTIYRPYSKITVASKSGISPLLKKMILDIQNTLEFDERDYQNLEGDEKRVIERIIRSQKEMKNYNIQALIDKDDFTAKKRLDILVGQVNAGNNSKLIREEMKALLKKLFDNKAISPTKYRSSLKAIQALES